jgi:hypothetical protein
MTVRIRMEATNALQRNNATTTRSTISGSGIGDGESRTAVVYIVWYMGALAVTCHARVHPDGTPEGDLM